LIQIDKLWTADPEEASGLCLLQNWFPTIPWREFILETNADAEWDNVSMRVVDLVSPIGFGQRGLIVAPPRTGKTVLAAGNCPFSSGK
jgi:transcription termination factor Rho